MIKKILAFSVLLNIGLFQGAAFAENKGPFVEANTPHHGAMLPPVPRCPPGYTWSSVQNTCTR